MKEFKHVVIRWKSPETESVELPSGQWIQVMPTRTITLRVEIDWDFFQKHFKGYNYTSQVAYSQPIMVMAKDPAAIAEQPIDEPSTGNKKKRNDK